jgi:hypothetical protein
MVIAHVAMRIVVSEMLMPCVAGLMGIRSPSGMCIKLLPVTLCLKAVLRLYKSF